MPLHALRILLLLGLLAASVLVVAGVVSALAPATEPTSAEFEERLPDLSALAFAGVVILVLPLVATALPLLLSLRGRRPGLARFGLGLLAPIVILWTVALFVDARDSLECSEVTLERLALPLGLGFVLLLALQPASLEAMGLDPRGRLAWARFGWSAMLAAALAADLVCVATCRRSAGDRLEAVRIGMTKQELRARVSSTCIEKRRGPSRVEIVCRPKAPPICRCAPTLVRTLLLEFDESARVRTVRFSLELVGLDRER